LKPASGSTQKKTTQGKDSELRKGGEDTLSPAGNQELFARLKQKLLNHTAGLEFARMVAGQ